MSERVRELAERQAELQLRCATQRRAVAREVRGIEAQLETVDRVATIARGVLLHPGVIVTGVAVFVAIGRVRMLRLIGRGLLLAVAVRRVFRAVKSL